MWTSLKRRWRYWLNREAEARELAEEMEFHRAQASAGLGNAVRHAEEARAVWIPPALDGLAADARHALRGLRKSPAFALTAVGTLALALGFGAAIVSLARAVLVRPLPFPRAEELVLVFEGAVGSPQVRGDTSPGVFRDLERNLKTVRGLALMAGIEANLTGDHEPERIDGGAVTPGFFTTIGVKPWLGRVFLESEGQPGKDQVVVLSYELWQRRYAGDPRILGREIRLNELPYTVVGVMPPGFRYYFSRPELWRPFTLAPEGWARRGARYVYLTGRLAPGATLARAQNELNGLAAQYRRDYPRENSKIALEAVGLRDRLTEGSRTSLWFLLAAVAALLLIACSNVANLLLTRSVVRGAEFEVRRALGASRARLLQHLLVEALTISACAAMVAVPVTAAGFRVLEALVPSGMEMYTILRLDLETAGTLAGLALAATLLSGLLPAFRGAQPMNTRAIGGRGHERIRGALIVAEVALAILLLSGAALLLRTFLNLQTMNPGFDAREVVSAQTWLPPALMKDPARRTRFYDDVLARVRALPGVTHAAYASTVPTLWKGGTSSFNAEGKPFERGTFAMMRQVTSGYFDTLRIRLRAGRVIDERDNANGEKVVVINQAMARRTWPGENPIGKRMRRGDPESGGPWITVVGLVDNVHEFGLDEEAPMITYFPESQHPNTTFSSPIFVMARGQGPLAAGLRQAILDVNPQQTVAKLLPVTEILEKERAGPRLRSLISGAFAMLALVLACFGLYGVLSYAVAARDREFGVRLALGASRSHLAGLVLGEGMRLSLVGAGLGLAAALALTRFMETLLFQVRPQDPAALLLVTGLLLATALTACWAPARRALRIDPARALRGQ